MWPTKRSSNHWHNARQLFNRCPVCNADYDQTEARTLGKAEQARLIHLTCPHCGSFFMALWVVLGQGLSSLGLVTDLSFTDLKRLQRALPITTDELIASYQELQQTDFAAALFNQRPAVN